MDPMTSDRQMVERPVPDELKTRAVAAVENSRDQAPRRGFFDGSTDQREIGHVGFLMTVLLFRLGQESLQGSLDRAFIGEGDQFDFTMDGETYDVKSSFSYQYRQRGSIPDEWGFLIPQSQWEYRPHDYYIRVVLDGSRPEQMTTCAWLCACMKKAVEISPVKDTQFPRFRDSAEMITVPMRVVAAKWTFPIRKLFVGAQLP